MKRRAEFGRPEVAYPARIESKDLGLGYLPGVGYQNRMHTGEQLRLGCFPVCVFQVGTVGSYLVIW